MNRLARFFEFSHLPEHLQAVSKPFHDLAKQIENLIPDNEEKHMAFRKLLESKDCAVRAALPDPNYVNVTIGPKPEPIDFNRTMTPQEWAVFRLDSGALTQNPIPVN